MLCLQSLLLRNFRNYQEERVDFHPRLNIIIGDNAQGKTNLLEAIAYLSLASSFREQNEEKMKLHDADFFFLRAALSRQNMEHTLSAGYQKRQKFWKKDGQPCKKVSEIAGFLHTVVFTPDDLELVKKSPDIRRLFLDREMIQLYQGYHLYLTNYKKALIQRNNLLKVIDYIPQSQSDIQLAVWEQQLADNGAVIILRRCEILRRLNEISGRIHSELTDGGETLRLKYISSFENKLNENKLDENKSGENKLEENKSENNLSSSYNKTFSRNAAELSQKLQKAYAENRAEDKRRHVTLLGPHRDDFAIYINDIEARYFGSQGQQRTAALSLKLSEVELAGEIVGHYPLLLLDDVFSELDAHRRRALLGLMLDKAQVFITATEVGDDLSFLTGGSYGLYEVSSGKVKRLK